MYMMNFVDVDIDTLQPTASFTDASYPLSNALTKWSDEKAICDTNSTTITFHSNNISDILLYNTNAIIGNVKVFDASNPTVLIKEDPDNLGFSEVIDFFTATSIAYASTNNLLYHRNIRAFHGEQLFETSVTYPTGFNIEIYLEADVGIPLEVGMIVAGLFIKYGDTQDVTPLPSKISYKALGTLAEYSMALTDTNNYDPFFAYTWRCPSDASHLHMGYGKPSITGVSRLGARNMSYSIDFKI